MLHTQIVWSLLTHAAHVWKRLLVLAYALEREHIVVKVSDRWLRCVYEIRIRFLRVLIVIHVAIPLRQRSPLRHRIRLVIDVGRSLSYISLIEIMIRLLRMRDFLTISSELFLRQC